MRIKICGITNLDDALMCQNLGADGIGFIFYPGSKRFIPADKVEEIVNRVSPLLLKIGVFVNEQVETVNQIIRTCRLHGAQLHGDESPQYVQQIHYPVIKAFRVDGQFDFSVITGYKNCGFLFDTYSPGLYGGSGECFNWDCIPERLRTTCMLAGGISITNIQQVFEKIRPAGVDLSSAVENFPGKKDPEKLKVFFKKIKMLRTAEY
jgi:phosphoribosylanthranilate isomerase